MNEGAMAVLSSASISLAQPVFAAQYGGFGSAGTAVLDPKDAQVESVTEDVKSGYSALKKAKSTVTAIRADLAKNPDADIVTRIGKVLPSMVFS
jgi:hypothetical protein